VVVCPRGLIDMEMPCPPTQDPYCESAHTDADACRGDPSAMACRSSDICVCPVDQIQPYGERYLRNEQRFQRINVKSSEPFSQTFCRSFDILSHEEVACAKALSASANGSGSIILFAIALQAIYHRMICEIAVIREPYCQ
jgi:hypothetical protein